MVDASQIDGILRDSDAEASGLIANMRWLGQLAARIVQDPGLAEDACQEAWIEATAGDGGVPNRTELAHGVKRFLYRYWRKDRRRKAREERVAVSEALPSIEDLLIQREQQRRIWSMLVELGEPYRTTLLLRFQEGLSTETIAVRSGISQDTVRWRIRRGTEMLRQGLRADEARGGLAAIAVAIPSSMREVPVKSTAGACSLTALTSVIGVLFMPKLALGITAAMAVALMCLLPRDDEMPKAALAEASVEPELKTTKILEPTVAVPEEAARLPVKLTHEQMIAELMSRPRVPWTVPLLRMHLSTVDGFALPRDISVHVKGYNDPGSVGPEVEATVSVGEGAVDVPLGSGPSLFGSTFSRGLVEITAKGFGTQGCQLPSLAWDDGDVTEVSMQLWPCLAVDVIAVHAGTNETAQGVAYGVAGPGSRFGAHYRAEAGGIVTINLSRPGSDGGAEDHICVKCDGASLGWWSTQELLALPRHVDGARRLEITGGSTVRGTIALESGMAIPSGTELRFSMRPAAKSGVKEFPHWLSPNGSVAIDDAGHFEISALPPGSLLVHLREKSRSIVAPQMSPDHMVEITKDSQIETQIVVPDKPQILSCNFSWGDNKHALFADLYRQADELDGPYANRPGTRELIFQKHWISPGEPSEIVLPAGTLREGEDYVLSIGLDFDRRLERLVRFKGDAPQLRHAFPKSARSELPAGVTGKGDKGAVADKRREVARRAGAKVILEATTPALEGRR